MRNLFICAVAMLATMSVNARDGINDTRSSDVIIHNGVKGFLIKGIFWAELNVGAVSDEDAGKYFTWEEAQTACPDGWRLPTAEEFAKLSKVENDWIRFRKNIEGTEGRRFYQKTIYPIFFLAAGPSDLGGTVSMIPNGAYWSSTPAGEDFARILLFTSDGVSRNKARSGSVAERNKKLPVRCVR